MVKQASLAAIAGRENVSPGSGAEAVDGIPPKTVIRPPTYEAVAATLRYANEVGLAVIPLGGRLHTGRGNLPARYDVALDVTQLDQVIEFEPADLTITVQAGMTLRALRQAAGEANMMVPFDPELPDGATVGGALATALSGSARLSLGAPRDFTIGMRVVTADGRITRAGGRVVKNVAGYDLCKLYVGSLGTLGVIVEATFKTIPLPMLTRTLAYEFAEPGAACAMVTRAQVAGLSLRSASLVRHDNHWRLTIGLAGMPAAVERSSRELGTSTASAADTTDLPRSSVCKLTILPNKLPPLLADIPHDADVEIEAHPATGIVRIAFDHPQALNAIRTLARKHSATGVIEGCPPDLKRDIDVFGPAPASLPLMRALKAEFDPNNILSPGRFVGKL